MKRVMASDEGSGEDVCRMSSGVIRWRRIDFVLFSSIGQNHGFLHTKLVFENVYNSFKMAPVAVVMIITKQLVFDN